MIEGFDIPPEAPKPVAEWAMEWCGFLFKLSCALLWVTLLTETLGETARAWKVTNSAASVADASPDPCLVTAVYWIFRSYDTNLDGLLDWRELGVLAQHTGDAATREELREAIKRWGEIGPPVKMGFYPAGLVRAYRAMGEAVLRSDASTIPPPQGSAAFRFTLRSGYPSPFVVDDATGPRACMWRHLGSTPGQPACMGSYDQGFLACRTAGSWRREGG